MKRLREIIQEARVILRGLQSPFTKFIGYFQLLDAFKHEGCPVCTLLEEGAVKALDGLMYEQVNDPFTRDRLVESHGFCNWHAWMIPSVHNTALGTVLIYKSLLDETLERLEAVRREARPRGRWRRLRESLTGWREEPLPMLAWRSKKTRCYLCTFARRTERDALQTILEFMGEADFAEAFSRSSGLCLPHLYGAMGVGRDHPNLQILLAAHAKRWRDLVWELEEFARKFDYRYADEPRGRESGSWHRALEAFVGRAGVFGPERGELPPPQEPKPEESAPVQDQSAQVAKNVEHAEFQSLRFENEKLRRRIEELLDQREEEQRARLTLEFQILKLTSELKTTVADLRAANPNRSAPDEVAETEGRTSSRGYEG